MEVEFVTAWRRTQTLNTPRPSDIREVGDDDVVACIAPVIAHSRGLTRHAAAGALDSMRRG
jgi:hypothetical protein